MNENKLTGVPSGFARLDEITGGFQKSDLIVFASRPGMGKTSLAINIAFHIHISENKNVLFFTHEMNQETVKKHFCSLDDGQEQLIVLLLSSLSFHAHLNHANVSVPGYVILNQADLFPNMRT